MSSVDKPGTITPASKINSITAGRQKGRFSPVNILVCGIINGQDGIRTLKHYLQQLPPGRIDLVIANVTNLIREGEISNLYLEVPAALTSGIPTLPNSSLFLFVRKSRFTFWSY